MVRQYIRMRKTVTSFINSAEKKYRGQVRYTNAITWDVKFLDLWMILGGEKRESRRAEF